MHVRRKYEKIRHFCRKVPILEIIGLCVYLGLLVHEWRSSQLTPLTDGKTLAYNIVVPIINAYLTVAGVLLTGILIAIASPGSVSNEGKEHARQAAGFAIASLLFGIIVLGYLPSNFGRHDVTSDMSTAILAAIQAATAWLAAIRVFLAILAITRSEV